MKQVPWNFSRLLAALALVALAAAPAATQRGQDQGQQAQRGAEQRQQAQAGSQIQLQVTTVQGEEDLARLRAALQAVAGVRQVTATRTRAAGAVAVTVLSAEPLQPQALVRAAAGAGFQAQVTAGPSPARGGRPAAERRGASAPEALRLVFLTGPFRQEAQGERLRQALARVQGVTEVELGEAAEPNLAQVTVSARYPAPLAQLLQVGRQLNTEIHLVEAGDPSAARPGRADPPAGQQRGAQQQQQRSVFMAATITTDQQAEVLRRALSAVEGVRQVTIQATNQPGVAQVTIVSQGQVSAEALAQAAAAAGFRLGSGER